MCCVGYPLWFGLSCYGSVWDGGILGHEDTDWLFSGLAFSGDRQDREDKTSHELLAQRYLFPRKALWDVFGMGSLRSITALRVGAQGAPGVSAPGGCPGAALLWGWRAPWALCTSEQLCITSGTRHVGDHVGKGCGMQLRPADGSSPQAQPGAPEGEGD